MGVRVRVYFCKEPDAGQRIGRQALDTIYDLVWESELKNVITMGRLWMRFRDEESPFGRALKAGRPHAKMAPGDIIQAGDEYFIVMDVGVKKIELD
jgi:hypothetical protein